LIFVVEVLGLQLLDFDRHLPLLSAAAITGDGFGARTCFHLNRLDVEAGASDPHPPLHLLGALWVTRHIGKAVIILLKGELGRD
jgi:hypothetical protein